ncbi:MAG: hypothetical protein AB8B69_16170 [Chitinophagales bacterium]
MTFWMESWSDGQEGFLNMILFIVRTISTRYTDYESPIFQIEKWGFLFEDSWMKNEKTALTYLLQVL